jgi:hypothetical protein
VRSIPRAGAVDSAVDPAAVSFAAFSAVCAAVSAAGSGTLPFPLPHHAIRTVMQAVIG